MGNLTYPHVLVPGTVENINHVQENFTAIATKFNSTLLQDDNLKSPTNAVWRPVHQAQGWIAGSTPVGTYVMTTMGGQMVLESDADGAAVWHPISADVAVPGKTTQIRLAGGLVVNGTSVSSVTFVIHLYAVSSVTGGAFVLAYTHGSSVENMAASPGASSITRMNTGEVTLPAAGSYYLAVTTLSATTPLNSLVQVTAAVEMRHV